MVDGAKLDTARDSVNVNANRKERKEENHYKSKSTRTPHKRDRKFQSLLAFTLETILRERLLEIIHPCCEVRICVGVGEPGPAQRREWREEEKKISATGQTRVDGQRNPLVDVRLRGETVRITPGVDILWSLIHPHVVNRHDRWEGQVLKIDGPEVGRNP